MFACRLLPLFLALVAAACAGPSDRARAATAMESLLETDRAWAAAAAAGDLDAVASYWAEDAVLHVPHGPALEGRATIRAMLDELAAQPEFSMSWHATGAQVSEDGTLGFTSGPYEVRFGGPDGKLSVQSGTYTTVFARQADGDWRCIYESQCPTDPRPGADDA